jgi:CRISPR/Cas system Type II protein with McrA/HNH and RuvC-like nuclease domain
MSVSKKIRFEVFKRDGFTCQYCGKHPPEATLEVDHINPVSKGGEDGINNLITSCFDCNRGKTNIELKRIPNTLLENKDILIERESQYLEYHKILAKVDKRERSEINLVDVEFQKFFIGRELSEQFKKGTVKMFIEKLNVFEVRDAMGIACSKFVNGKRQYSNNRWWTEDELAVKYFCGICWNKIKKLES